MAVSSDGPPPATAAWREGDPPADRRFADLGALVLEGGGALPSVRVAYEEWGVRDEDGSNSVLVLHALTGDAHVVGPAGPGQHHRGLVGRTDRAGRADRHRSLARGRPEHPRRLPGHDRAVVAGEGRPWGSRFPQITVRDQVAVEVALADYLGIDRWAAVVGGSMGGMRALEWLVGPARPGGRRAGAGGGRRGDRRPDRHPGRAGLAIRSDPQWRGGDYHGAAPGEGPHAGMGLAHRIAHLTYRTEYELEVRFGRQPQGDEDPLPGRAVRRAVVP